MNKELKELLIVVVLIAILAGVLFSNTKKRKPAPGKDEVKAASLAPQETKDLPRPVLKAQDRGNFAQAQLERSKQEWGRNPFHMKSGDDYGKSELLLKGISYGQDKKGMAFINNDIVKEGDTVEGYIVMKIEKERVLVSKGEQSFYLTFPE